MSGPEEIIDLTNISGTPPISPDTQKPRQYEPENDLDALAELVPGVRNQNSNPGMHKSMTATKGRKRNFWEQGRENKTHG